MRAVTLLLLSALAACGQSAEEKRAADDADVAAVKDAQNRMPPLLPVKPEVLMDGDMARIDASGPGCIVLMGQGPAVPVLVTVGSFGWLKLDGTILKIAGDSGSDRGPADTWTHYTGKQTSVRIRFESGDSAPTSAPGEDHVVTLTMRDAYDRVIYRGQGMQTCSE